MKSSGVSDDNAPSTAGLTSLPRRVPDNTRELWLQNNTINTVDKLPYLQKLHSLKLTANNVQVSPSNG